jgi:flagellar basal-body rod protein FlgF
MDPLTSVAASGLRARLESLDLIANNLSNAGTSGYKADREFYNLYFSGDAADGFSGQTAQLQPVIETNWTDFGQGLLSETRNPLDLALAGRGFFVVDAPAGPVYTRNGSFRLSTKGVLETQDGYPVRALGPVKTITVPPGPGGPVSIDRSGAVQRDGQLLGRMEISDFPDPKALEKSGGGYFRLTRTGIAAVPSPAEVHQGKLENSNTGPAESAVRLISVMRQFEALQHAITLGAEMNRRAVDDVARVSS